MHGPLEVPEAGEIRDGLRTMQCISLWEGSPEGEGECGISQERRIQDIQDISADKRR